LNHVNFNKMSVKIRLARRGRTKNPYYHIVVADARAPRDGKFIERIGMYNPMTKPATIDLDRDRAYDWLTRGAQPTDTARAILKFKGVLYRKHLMRGVAKGALTEEAAMKKYQEFVDAKETKVAARFEETRLERENYWKTLSGEIKPKQAKKVDEETAAAFREDGETPAAEGEETAPVAAAAVAAEVVAEAVAPAAEEAKAEAPAAEEAKVEAPAAAPVVEAAAEKVAEVKEEVAAAAPEAPAASEEE
jgi:small subunit ribosomal protein S16